MLGTIVNTIAILAGSILGLVFHKHIHEGLRGVVFTGTGLVSLVIGVGMALESQRILYLALSLVLGGILGERLGIENRILGFGEYLRRKFVSGAGEGQFAAAFLTSSVLYCVGAMAIIGAFRAGVDGDYELLFTKSVMDGFMSILLAGAMGIGVAFSAVSVLLYQGALTLLSVQLRPLVNELVLSELTGVGGTLVIMIGLNLLSLKEIKTANFLPSLVFVVLFVALDPFLPLA
ncbi:MAG: DUF554 domain-containing protein [Spirochaetaceae bacterium]|nr:MAG: DUF554 domain-containing protein [Spirochaetaceae bacterium]